MEPPSSHLPGVNTQAAETEKTLEILNQIADPVKTRSTAVDSLKSKIFSSSNRELKRNIKLLDPQVVSNVMTGMGQKQLIACLKFFKKEKGPLSANILNDPTLNQNFKDRVRHDIKNLMVFKEFRDDLLETINLNPAKHSKEEIKEIIKNNLNKILGQGELEDYKILLGEKAENYVADCMGYYLVNSPSTQEQWEKNISRLAEGLMSLVKETYIQERARDQEGYDHFTAGRAKQEAGETKELSIQDHAEKVAVDWVDNFTKTLLNRNTLSKLSGDQTQSEKMLKSLDTILFFILDENVMIPSSTLKESFNELAIDKDNFLLALPQSIKEKYARCLAFEATKSADSLVDKLRFRSRSDILEYLKTSENKDIKLLYSSCNPHSDDRINKGLDLLLKYKISKAELEEIMDVVSGEYQYARNRVRFTDIFPFVIDRVIQMKYMRSIDSSHEYYYKNIFQAVGRETLESDGDGAIGIWSAKRT
jgi:hypothetical protein